MEKSASGTERRRDIRQHQDRPILSVHDVSFSYDASQVLHRVSLVVRAGEITGLIGPNGAGKTTLVDAIAGLHRVDEGRICLNGVDLSGLSAARRARFGVSRTFQIPRVEKNLSIEEQLAAQSSKYCLANWLRRSSFRVPISSTLIRFGLSSKARSTAGDLTLADLRAFEFVRALMRPVRLLLVDEPASGLTAWEIRVLAEALREICAQGVGVLLVEHNIPFVKAICDRVVVLSSGEVIADGTPTEVFELARVKEAYLGRSADR